MGSCMEFTGPPICPITYSVLDRMVQRPDEGPARLACYLSGSSTSLKPATAIWCHLLQNVGNQILQVEVAFLTNTADSTGIFEFCPPKSWS